MKRALVIGGTGFLGLNLVDELLAGGVEVRATRRRKSITAFLRKRPVELVNASFDDALSLKNAMVGCDAVFHVAGYYPRYSLDRDAALSEATAGIDAVCAAALSAESHAWSTPRPLGR